MSIAADVAIVGAGIAGLWTAHRLRTAGYSVVVVTDRAPGAGQTIASQGIVHSGLKYALGGSLNAASEQIADMPDHWRGCMVGQGDVDLRGVEMSSDAFYMMADASVTSRLTAFFGGQLTAGRSHRLKRDAFPPALDTPEFQGTVFAMSDFVLSAESVVDHLCTDLTIVQERVEAKIDGGNLVNLETDSGRHIKAQHFVFAAGAGNETLIAEANLPFRTQRRPLCQVSVHAPGIPPLFAHVVSLRHGSKPRVTITSHRDHDGNVVWYLGGNLAEQGARRRDAEQIEHARAELNNLFPWIDGLRRADIRCHRIDRSEPAAEHKRPKEPVCLARGNISVGWPIKFTMAPMLANQVLNSLSHISPGVPQPAPTGTPAVAAPPWT